MEKDFCSLFSEINWMWYWIACLSVFIIGFLWYNVLFKKKWLANIRYECECGANLSKGEACTCKMNSFKVWIPMIFQVVSILLLCLMYFVLTDLNIWISIIVLVCINGWNKASLKFEIPSWKTFVNLAGVNVGYFSVASIVAILFALIK